MKKSLICIAALIGILSACNIQEADSLRTSKDVSFYAVNGDAPETKTVLQEDGKIWWSPQDEINIFYGESGNYKFTSTNTIASANAEFKGSLEYEVGKNEYWAVYPYSLENTFDGSSFSVTLPSEQYAVAGSFKDDLFISVAKTTDKNLVFYNVCGGVKFTVTQPGVTSVVFKGNNNEVLAGTASVSFDSNGKPYVQSVSDAKTQISVSLESGAPFAVETWYYIVAFPGTLSSGYSMTLTLADTKQTVKANTKPVTIKRSIWGKLEDADELLEYNIPENQFWYKTTDNEPITDLIDLEKLGTIVSHSLSSTGWYVVTYDKPVTSIPDRAFWCVYDPYNEYSGMYGKLGYKRISHIIIPPAVQSIGYDNFQLFDALETITIPNSVKTIGANFCRNNNNLKSIVLPEGLEAIEGGSFLDCYYLSSVEIPASLLSIGDYCFGGTQNLQTIRVSSSNPQYDSRDNCNAVIETSSNALKIGCRSTIIPTTVEAIRTGAFYYQSFLSSITIPESVTKIEYGAFSGCDGLHSIVIPKSVSFIGIGAFDGCTGLAYATIEAATPPIITGNPFPANDCPIYVPGESIDLFKTADVWSTFAERIFAKGIYAVDMGLSVKWASCNLGAIEPQGYGDYYAWGETEPYYVSLDPLVWKEGKTAGYAWASYKWCNGSSVTLTKYNTKEDRGVVDNMKDFKDFNYEDDAARQSLGGAWRIPTYEEWIELHNNCTWILLMR